MTIHKMSKAAYDEWRYKYSLMDTDYVVDVLGITSLELIDAFPNRFATFIETEFTFDDEEVDEGTDEPKPTFEKEW